jgi:hypothetical protein
VSGSRKVEGAEDSRYDWNTIPETPTPARIKLEAYLDRFEGKPDFAQVNPLAGGGVSFINDVPGAPSTDRAVDVRLANALETALDATGSSVNINSTTGGHSKGPHVDGRGIDINRIDGVNVSDRSSHETLERLARALAQMPGVSQVISPVFSVNIDQNGRQTPITDAKLLKQHATHLHVGVRPRR